MKYYEEKPQGDLISREALRKAFHERIYYFDKSSWCVANALIDNAPSVETYSKEDMAGAYNEGYACGSRENTRPTGEWIIVKDKKWGDNVKCPFCEKELAGTDLNFCCKCGSRLIGSEKMNGGAE